MDPNKFRTSRLQKLEEFYNTNEESEPMPIKIKLILIFVILVFAYFLYNIFSGFFIPNHSDAVMPLPTTNQNTLSSDQNKDKLYFDSTGSVKFSFTVTKVSEKNHSVGFLYNGKEYITATGTEMCVSENQFDAPKKQIPDLQFPILKCINNNVFTYYSAYMSSTSIFTIKKLNTREICADFTVCSPEKSKDAMLFPEKLK